MPQLAPCARAVAQPLAKGSSSVRQISLDQGKDCWPSQLWGGVRPRAPHPQNRKPFETQLHHRCGGLSGVDCRGLGEGKGTQRIRKDARRTKSKKGRKKAPDESDGVNSEGGTAKARALTQLPSLESGEAGPGEGSKGEGEGERRESTAKREGDVSQEGRFATFLYSGIAGLALAGVGWLVAPQAIELLGGKHVESGAFPQVGYEKAAREEKVERIVARQLAQRFREMPPDELAAVLESLINARSLSAPQLTGIPDLTAPSREQKEPAPPIARQAQQTPAYSASSPQAGGQTERSEAQGTAETALNPAQAIIDLGRDRGRESAGLPRDGGATEKPHADTSGQWTGEEEARGSGRGRKEEAGGVVKSTPSQGAAASGQTGEVERKESAALPGGENERGEIVGDSIGRLGNTKGESLGSKVNEKSHFKDGEGPQLGVGESGSTQEQGFQEGGINDIADVSGRDSQAEAAPDAESASDVTLERLRAAGIDLDALFSDRGGGGSAQSGGEDAAVSEPGDPPGLGGLAGALAAVAGKARGWRVDPEALFAPLWGTFPAAEFERAFAEVKGAVHGSEVLKNLEGLRESMAEKGLEGLRESVVENWARQGRSTQLAEAAAVLLGVVGVASALRGSVLGGGSEQERGASTQVGLEKVEASSEAQNRLRRPPLRGGIVQPVRGSDGLTGQQRLGLDGVAYLGARGANRGSQDDERGLETVRDVGRGLADVSGRAAGSGGGMLWVRDEESAADEEMGEGGDIATSDGPQSRAVPSRGVSEEGLRTERFGGRSLGETRQGGTSEKDGVVGGLHNEDEEKHQRPEKLGDGSRGEAKSRQLHVAARPSAEEAVRLGDIGAPERGHGGVTPGSDELGSVTQLLSRRRPKRGRGVSLDLLRTDVRRGGVSGAIRGGEESSGDAVRVAQSARGTEVHNWYSAPGEDMRIENGALRQTSEGGRDMPRSSRVQERQGGDLMEEQDPEPGQGVIAEEKSGKDERELGEGREGEKGRAHSWGGSAEPWMGATSGVRVYHPKWGGENGVSGGLIAAHHAALHRRGEGAQEKGRQEQASGEEKRFIKDPDVRSEWTRLEKKPVATKPVARPSRGMRFFDRATEANGLGPRGSPRSPSLVAAAEGRRYLQHVPLQRADGRPKGSVRGSEDSSKESLESHEGVPKTESDPFPEQYQGSTTPVEQQPRVSQPGRREVGPAIGRAVFTLAGADGASTRRRYVRPSLGPPKMSPRRSGFRGDVPVAMEAGSEESPPEAAPGSQGASGFVPTSAEATTVTSTGARLITAAAHPHVSLRFLESPGPHVVKDGAANGHMAATNFVDNSVVLESEVQEHIPKGSEPGIDGHSEHDWREAFRHSRRDVWADTDMPS